MSTERLLRDRVGSFLRRQYGLDTTRIVADDEYPQALEAAAFPELRAAFPNFVWLMLHAEPAQGGGNPDNPAHPASVIGIRKLVDRLPFRLSDLRAMGFNAESIRYPIRPPVRGVVEHYLIAELQGPAMARVSLCMHVPPDEWYVLDEHRLTRGADSGAPES